MGANQVKEATAYFTEFAKHRRADGKQANALMHNSNSNNHNSNKDTQNTEGSSVSANVDPSITNEQNNNEADHAFQNHLDNNHANDELEYEMNGIYSRESFLDEIALYSEALNGGMELYSIVEPIAQTIIQFNPQTNRLRWLCTLVADVLQEVRFAFSDNAFLADSQSQQVTEQIDRGTNINKDEVSAPIDLSRQEKMNNKVNSEVNVTTNITDHRTQSVSDTLMHSLSINTFMEDSDLSTITACVNALELVFRHLLQVVRGDQQLLLQLIEGNLLLHTQHTYNMKDNSTTSDNEYETIKKEYQEEKESCKVARRLCEAMISSTIHVECVSHTLPLHAAVMRFMCTLTSTTLHHKINHAVKPQTTVKSTLCSSENMSSGNLSASIPSQSQCQSDVFTEIILSLSSSICTEKTELEVEKFGQLHQLVDVLLERAKWWGTLDSFSSFPLATTPTTAAKHSQSSSINKTKWSSSSSSNYNNKELYLAPASQRKLLQSLESFHVMYAAGYSPSLRNMFYWFGNDTHAIIKPPVESTPNINSSERNSRTKVALQSTKSTTENQRPDYKTNVNVKDVKKSNYTMSGSNALELDNKSINEAVNNTLMLVHAQHKELSKSLSDSSTLPTSMAHTSSSLEMSNSSVTSELSETLTPLQSLTQQTQAMDTSASPEIASNHKYTCEQPLHINNESGKFVLPPLRVMSSMSFSDKDE